LRLVAGLEVDGENLIPSRKLLAPPPLRFPELVDGHRSLAQDLGDLLGQSPLVKALNSASAFHVPQLGQQREVLALHHPADQGVELEDLDQLELDYLPHHVQSDQVYPRLGFGKLGIPVDVQASF
jgi:hypothetical protein